MDPLSTPSSPIDRSDLTDPTVKQKIHFQAATLCHEIIQNLNRSNLKTYREQFNHQCKPLLNDKTISADLREKILSADRKLETLAGRPPLHPKAAKKGQPAPIIHKGPTGSEEHEIIINMYNSLTKTDFNKLTVRELLGSVLDCITIDAFYTKNPPYPSDIDIGTPLLAITGCLATHGIVLTDPDRPSWSDYAKNATAELKKLITPKS